MLEDQVANLLQRYLGNYVKGLSKEALKISVWKGAYCTITYLSSKAVANLLSFFSFRQSRFDNRCSRSDFLHLAGVAGSALLLKSLCFNHFDMAKSCNVPWSRLGQEPVLVYLDHIFLLAEPATTVEGYDDETVQETKKSRLQEMEMKLLERSRQLKTEVNKSWLGSLINTIIGNLKLSISNIHIRYEDVESNPGHPFATGVTLEKLTAVTVDDSGMETFVTGGALDCIKKSVELERLAVYLDSDISPWHLDMPWEKLHPSEWIQVFRFGTQNGKPSDRLVKKHRYILQPVTGNAKYVKLQPNKDTERDEPLQKAFVHLDDVTLCISKDGYRDVLKFADNFAVYNQRLKYVHYRPHASIKLSPGSWWKYAFRAISDQINMGSGRLSWEQVLRYARLRKRYIYLYASLLKSDPSHAVINDNKEIEEMDRELDSELILQWRMLAHKFVERSESDKYLRKDKKEKKSWWSIGWRRQPSKDEGEPFHFSEEDWVQLNKIIGYKEADDEHMAIITEKSDALHTFLEVHMKHNASKLINDDQEIAALSSESLSCSIKLYPEAKVVDVRLGSYQLSSPSGLLAKSATASDSLVALFCYKPFDVKVDWSMAAKASPCHMTYIKDSIDSIVNFFESNAGVSQKIALETVAAVQMTIDEVKRSAQQQVNKALKDQSRFLLDFDIAAPKITIPTDFYPDNKHSTKLLLDLGNLMIHTQDDYNGESNAERDMYMQFNLVLSDVCAFLVDGDYSWNEKPLDISSGEITFLPVIDKCGVSLHLQQIRMVNPSFPSTRLAVRLPSLGFHFSPARYHRLMQIIKIFQKEDAETSYSNQPWSQADLEGWSYVLVCKGREALWKRRYLCLVGPFLYALESPNSQSYKQYTSLRGKQIYQIPLGSVGDGEYVFAISTAGRSNNKILEDGTAIILRWDNKESLYHWKNRLQGAIYRASGPAPITGLSESSSDDEDPVKRDYDELALTDLSNFEKVFITGVLDELKICFYYNNLCDPSFLNLLLADEHRLIEFRAIGGQVELSLKSNDVLIGTLLKSLEIEDLISKSGVSQPRYLARSFIHSVNSSSSFHDTKSQSLDINETMTSEGDDKFYEAPENLMDPSDSSTLSLVNMPENGSTGAISPSQVMFLKPPSFRRVAGLLPYYTQLSPQENIDLTDTLDSFVKAQTVIYDRNSPLYENIDMQVTVTMATLSFFCRPPTIIAIIEFVNAINTEDKNTESFNDNSSVTINHGSPSDVAEDQLSVTVEDSIVKGLLGKGKSRTMFNLKLNMASAKILLMNENEAKLATLSQDNLLTDIKVFPSSFCIKAALGNLRISDDSLPSSHMYYQICDTRHPGSNSFVELLFSSFSTDDGDYEGYEYSLSGQLSEVRIVYLNRFIQEIVSYFMGLVPTNSKDIVKLNDQVMNTEKSLTASKIGGSSAMKLGLSLRSPIILMPRRTDSIDYLKLDVVNITIENTFHWYSGSRKEMNAVHVEIMTISVKDINLNVGTGSEIGESIIHDVKGVSIVVHRALRDLLHQIPNIEVGIKIEEMKATLSSTEYRIITECAQSNISETPDLPPPLGRDFLASSPDESKPQVPYGSEVEAVLPREVWTVIKVSILIDLIEMCLHTGPAGDAPLATVQISSMWLLYKSNSFGDGLLSASLGGFSVIDDRDGIAEQFRLAVGKSEELNDKSVCHMANHISWNIDNLDDLKDHDIRLNTTMLILDAKFSNSSTFISLCIQRPQLLVALDFLRAVVEFFAPNVGSMPLNDEDKKSFGEVVAVVWDHSIYWQPCPEIIISPQRPLIIDDERFDHFIYDGQGGILYLNDRYGSNLFAPRSETLVYVGNGKRLQFRNVTIKNGRFLDSCILLGANSSYSALEEDNVHLEDFDVASQKHLSGEGPTRVSTQNALPLQKSELILELQVIGPELTFYSTSKEMDMTQSPVLSNRLLHAQLDLLCRFVMKGDMIEVDASALGFTMESNGIRILEPFDTTLNHSNASGKTIIHLSVSDVFMNFSFSILRLFLAVQEDILSFLRTSSKKMTVVCTQFDRVGTIRNPQNDQVYVFWRPRAPPGFVVLGDYLTPMEKPPRKGVLAINTNVARVKKPISFKLIWASQGSSKQVLYDQWSSSESENADCFVWFPEAPEGYISLGCIVSQGLHPPPLSSVSCIMASLVTPCSLRDCVTISSNNLYSPVLAFWRVDNSFGSFLPAEPSFKLMARAYELRHVMFSSLDSKKAYDNSNLETSSPGYIDNACSESLAEVNSDQRFEAVANFQLVWWNQGSRWRKRLSIWRPSLSPGMVYFGDNAVQGYEPPNTCIVLHDTGNEEILRSPVDFQLVGHIKRYRGMESISFWMPQAPQGFVSLGCVASKSMPKQSDFSALRCIRSDMVTGDQFLDERLWDTSEAKATESFSIWAVGNDFGTFIVRTGFKRPPRRFALKLADLNLSRGSDDMVVDAKIGTFSAALYDDYGGLMVPLLNISLDGVRFSLNARSDYMNSTISFAFAARSYNDKYNSWEPLVEPVDGFLRYQYDLNIPHATSQLRITSTGDVNLNVSVSSANMIIQAYASWSNLSHVQEINKNRVPISSSYSGGAVIGAHNRRDYFIIPRNKLGQDIYIRATEVRGLSNISRMLSGDVKPLKVPVLKNMLDSHLKGNLSSETRWTVTVLLLEGQIQRVDGLGSHEYAVAIRLLPDGSTDETMLKNQSARTCGSNSVHSGSSVQENVYWNEIFFFKINHADNYMVELILTDLGKCDAIGVFSAPLKQIAGKIMDIDQTSFFNNLAWIDLFSAKSKDADGHEGTKQPCGRVRCGILFSTSTEFEDTELSCLTDRRSGFIQISPSKEGPWTSVRLNYAAPAACWRLGNNVIASELSVKDDSRYVDIRSLVSLRNNTDIALEFCLKLKGSADGMSLSNDPNEVDEQQMTRDRIEKDEHFETQEYNSSIGWVSSSARLKQEDIDGSLYKGNPNTELPLGWEWIDDWVIDKTLVKNSDGWVYAPDMESLKWPESYNSPSFVNYARQRRWVRNRRLLSVGMNEEIPIGSLSPGESIPIPLSGLSLPGQYLLHLRPCNLSNSNEYSWSSVVEKLENLEKSKGNSEVCVSDLSETDELLCCVELSGTSSRRTHKLWFCVSIQATEIAKDIHSDPIQDWSIVVKSPLSFTNFLPLSAEYAVLEMQPGGNLVSCSRGILSPGKVVNVYSVDITKPLFFSFIPQRGWSPIHDAVLIAHPHEVPSKTMSLRSVVTGRIVHIILEQNFDRGQPFLGKNIRIYASNWVSIARCPPLKYRFMNVEGEKSTRKLSLSFSSAKSNECSFEEIIDEEIYDGYTIASAFNFNTLGISMSFSSEERFGPVKRLHSLGDMDGSAAINAYNSDGKCMKFFISTKPSPHQSLPSKVICIRPFMTFTNRIGQDIHLKLGNEDEPKVLRASDSRISFMYREMNGPDILQVKLEATCWSFPIEITKEDSISLVLRRQDGTQKFIRTEIRGYEEGSRFIVVFRLGSIIGPMRMENRTRTRISIRQAGFGEDYWILLQPLSSTNFSWENPYGQRFIDAKVDKGCSTQTWTLDLDKTGQYSLDEGEQDLQIEVHVAEIGEVKVARFIDCSAWLNKNTKKNIYLQEVRQTHSMPVELVVELGVVGISLVDHRPKELSYLYLERVFICYSTGYDEGATTRFKLILGYLQLDNQLPMTLMPVLLAPEQVSDVHHPVFKMTITICNDNPSGVLIYPYVYIRVTEKVWRLNIHEPIIWALVDFYNSIQLDKLPQTSSVTQIDPEIRVNLVDISEVRLKVSLETEPAQRPHGVLGVWSPILSAVGNALKIQVHLRRVMHRDRFMRQSSVLPAITNRIFRDLIHNPLHLLFSLDVLGMASSTLASLGKGFAELSTDGQFLQLRSNQVRSRKITGVGDAIVQGTEAFAQGVAFGVTGVVTKPMESARQNGLLGLANGVGRAFLGCVVQPVSGALDFFSMTVDGIGASCTKCLEVFDNKINFQRTRNPRAIHADGILKNYIEREALGQMVLHLAQGSWHLGCTELFKEPAKFAWSDYYEDHFIIPYQRIVLVTNRRVMLLQFLDPDKLDKKPCKILWDVPWQELMALELAKAGFDQPSHLILHLKIFNRSESFVKVIKCIIQEEPEESIPQAVRICSLVRKMWKAHESDMKCLALKVPSSQRHVYFAWSEVDGRESWASKEHIIRSREGSSSLSVLGERRFVKLSINFVKIWSSEQETKGRCKLGRKQASRENEVCTIWRPVCPEGYVSIGDVVHIGIHPPNCAAVYCNIKSVFALPVGYDLVWRNCLDDYTAPVSIWHPRAPDGFVSLGCVAVTSFSEPEPDLVYCVAESLAEQAEFEDQKVWSAPESYPWACHVYQIKSDALHFAALRQVRDESDWTPTRVLNDPSSVLLS
ncbi:hypothetical protein SAY87_012827 [Trapa incisa]|uniref:PH domain-containing protein n=1 Tax=Trapa incisa TaxID=236973 RepID=A0AAN7JK42_9MYRT|nr:hypothetical protein SAY87_012827 [Trapa incisa]